MKIKVFRISYLISMILLDILSIYYVIASFLTMNSDNASLYTVMILCFVLCIIFFSFEIYMIIASFKRGTALMQILVFDAKKHLRKWVVILSLIAGVAALFFAIFFGLCGALGVNPYIPEAVQLIDCRLILVTFLLISVNAFALGIYGLLFRKDTFSLDLI